MRVTSTTVKYRFRIRTRHGLLLDNLVIQGREEADAERKLRQMYQHCQILECTIVAAPLKDEHMSFEDVVSLLTK